MSKEMEKLRIVRNTYLSESDWTVMADSPLSESKQTEWKIYRQSLRDITKTAKPKVDSNKLQLEPSSVTFPTKPS